MVDMLLLRLYTKCSWFNYHLQDCACSDIGSILACAAGQNRTHEVGC
jgi:hypothetical protein